MTISDEAVEAAADLLFSGWEQSPEEWKESFRRRASAALEAAYPFMLSHEREETRLAHLDAMVNRETKREELAEAWDSGHQSGFWSGRKSNGDVTGMLIGVEHAKKHNPYR